MGVYNICIVKVYKNNGGNIKEWGGVIMLYCPCFVHGVIRVLIIIYSNNQDYTFYSLRLPLTEYEIDKLIEKSSMKIPTSLI